MIKAIGHWWPWQGWVNEVRGFFQPKWLCNSQHPASKDTPGQKTLCSVGYCCSAMGNWNGLIGVFTGELWGNSPKIWTALHRRWRLVLKSVCKCFSVGQRNNSDLGKLQMRLWWELRCSFLLPTTPSGRQEQRKEYSSNSLNPQLCQVHNPTKQVKLFLQHYPHKPPSWGCSEIPIMSCVGPGLHSPVDHYSSEHSLANYLGS